MIGSRCGLQCSGCSWKETHGCGGCIETMGHPFHGQCPIALCCQGRGYNHCGECDIIPCNMLYSYSYLDPDHGDKPQGKRVEHCRKWAAESGINCWEKVLLTSAGFEDLDGNPNQAVVDAFLKMLEKPIGETKVLFIPSAAIDDEAKYYAGLCRQELIRLGIKENNLTTYNMDGSITEEMAMSNDVIYFTGGTTSHLLSLIKKTGFDTVIKKMVYANKVYVGVSAGSIIATPSIGDIHNEEASGLCLIHAYISVHCAIDLQARTDLPLPHVPLNDNQAIVVRYDGYEVIGI